MSKTPLMLESMTLLKSFGFSEVFPLTLDGKKVGILLERDDQQYCMVAKKYAFRGLASFMRQVTEFGIENDTRFIFYDARDQEFTVFDPETVRDRAVPSVGDSLVGHAEWRELPLSLGVPLSAHLGIESIGSPADENQATLGEWT